VRQALLTGLYPVRSGAYPNHSQVKPGAKSLPHHLKSLGYRTACIGKTHFGPPESYPFDVMDRSAKKMKPKAGADDEDDGEELNLQTFERFIAETDQTICAYLASHEPHGPITKGDTSAYDPKSFVLAPYLVDTPVTRGALQGYYAEVGELDREVGQVMRILEKMGKAENTLLFFFSEQQDRMPFAKWTLYNPGIRVRQQGDEGDTTEREAYEHHPL